MQTPKQREGALGELKAEFFLKEKGYIIIDRNFKCRFGEIDLIATHHEKLIFVEVKTRASLQFGQPYEAVNLHKIRSISNTGRYFAEKFPNLLASQQIDVVSIQLDFNGNIRQIEHLENVTG